MSKHPRDTAQLELEDFIRRTEETLDEPALRQFEAALAYVKGHSQTVKLDLKTIQRKARLIK